METVAEFKVITNGISAEYGRLSGGAVEVITKSGSTRSTASCSSISRTTI